MRLHLLAAATALTLALAGCASSGGLHPDGTPMDPSSLKAERSLAKLQVSPAAWPQADWWTGLGDAQLNALNDDVKMQAMVAMLGVLRILVTFLLALVAVRDIVISSAALQLLCSH